MLEQVHEALEPALGTKVSMVPGPASPIMPSAQRNLDIQHHSSELACSLLEHVGMHFFTFQKTFATSDLNGVFWHSKTKCQVTCYTLY